jgi:DNA polymerase-3 subunit delta
VYVSLFNADLREDDLLPCYVFFGEETFLADQFVDQIRGLLSAASGEDLHLDRYDLEDSGWPEIIDTARTVPFLFHPWRILVVRVPERRPGANDRGWKKGSAAEDEGKGVKFLSQSDRKAVADFLAEPTPRTVIVVILSGKVRKNDAIVRFFSGLPRSAVAVKEVKPFSREAVKRWADGKAQELGKSLSDAANARLYDVVGSDLRLLANELEKLAVYVGEKKRIEEGDVDEATAWVRSYKSYELDDALTGADFEKGIAVLNNLFAEGEKPEMILARMSVFFRNILTAQVWLREKSRGREEIFQTFFPYIQKTHIDLYRTKSKVFFEAVEALTPAELNTVLRALRQSDLKIKTTEADEKTVFEIFLMEYCLMRKRKAPTSRG